MSDQDDTKTTDDDGASGDSGGGGNDQPRTFTQAELDRIVGERLARERDRYGDYDALKEKASKLDEIEAANQTELEKAQKAQEAAQRQLEELKAREQRRAVSDAIRAEAIKANAVDADAVVALVLANHDLKVGDDGKVAGVDEVIAALTESNKRLFGTSNGQPDPDQGARSGGRPTQLTRDALKNMTPDEISQARREGRLDDLMAGRG